MEEHGAGIGEAHGSWVHGLVKTINDAAGLRLVDDFVLVSWLVMAFLLLLAIAAGRRRQWVPHGVQNLMEFVVESLNSMTVLIIGPHGSRYTPLIGTLFIYIFACNLVGLIPGFVSPTANLNHNLALAIVTMVLVQYFGIREVGLKHYLMHFVGEPKIMAPVNIFMHLISEFFAKPLSLAVRLFGNIFGKEKVLVEIAMLGVAAYATTKIPIPVQLPIVAFGMFVGFVQAMVFSMLAAVYIALMTAHEEEHEHASAH